MSAMASADANHIEMPSLEDYPKIVFVHLPMPKPPMSPAQLLNLSGAEYDKAEKCLAQAIYFEARAEPVRGQQAVAQVVLNRVFSPYYPKDVCSVVYQNAHRHLSCQFTFACDGKAEAIRERGSWARANRIARQALHATVWLPEVAKATHYHATYVRPDWIRDMKLLVKHGVHKPPAQLGRRLPGSAVGHDVGGSCRGAGADDAGRAQEERHEVVSFLRA